jgi:hypothetical protein
MPRLIRPTGRSEAVLRLVHAAAASDGETIVVDGLVAATDGAEGWPAKGEPVSLRLELPESSWMAEALAQLLTEWADEDAVVTTTIVTTAHHTVARFSHRSAYVSLELVASA